MKCLVVCTLSQEPLTPHTAENTLDTHLFLSRFSEAASLQAKKEGTCLLLLPSLPDLGDLLLPLHDTPSPATTQTWGKLLLKGHHSVFSGGSCF